MPSPKKIKFGLKSDTDNSSRDKVNIEQSTAFAAILLELMTITGRHDLVQKYVNLIDKENKTALSQRGKKTFQTKSMDVELCNTKIQLLIAQFVYLRSDIAYKRRLNICRQLLQALFESPFENDATAFAAMVFLSVDTSLVKGLLPQILQLVSRKKISTNLDFHLAASHLINGAGKKALGSIIKTSDQRLLLSMSPLLKPMGRTPEAMFSDLFMILGDDHEGSAPTMLYKLLFNPNDREKNIYTIRSIFSRLSHIMAWILDNVFILPTHVDQKEIQKESIQLATLVKRMDPYLKGGTASEVLDNIYNYLKDYVYLPSGLCEKISNWFIKNHEEVTQFLCQTVKQLEKKMISVKSAITDQKIKYLRCLMCLSRSDI